MENYKELKSTEEIEDVFGKRRDITFRCGNCHCAFSKQELSVVADSELAINPCDYWKDRLKGK